MTHITATEAHSLLASGNWEYAGQRDGKSVMMMREHRVVFWNGSTQSNDPRVGTPMKIPGEVIS